MKNKWRSELFPIIFLVAVIVAGVVMFSAKNEYPVADAGEKDMLRVDFLDVGSADSALISCGGEYLLIDGGNAGDAKTVAAAIRRSGAKKLDYVVCTHPHEDHMGGLPQIFSQFSVEKVFCSTDSDDSAYFSDFLHQINAQGKEICVPKQGESFEVGKATVIFLSSGEYFENENDRSLVLKIYFGDTSFLFTGDIELQGEKALAEGRSDLSCDVLKVAHHGGEKASTESFLERCSPSYAVVSAAATNLPSEKVITRLEDIGCTVLRTDIRGDIKVVSDGKRLSFEFEKTPTQE